MQIIGIYFCRVNDHRLIMAVEHRLNGREKNIHRSIDRIQRKVGAVIEQKMMA